MTKSRTDSNAMRHVAVIVVHLICTLVRLLHPGGLREVVAESLLVKHQLLVLNRPRQRAPKLRPTDRVIAGLCALLMRHSRVLKSAIVLRPSTIMGFHRALVKRKYRSLFTPHRHTKPGPKGPTPELIAAILEMKQRNPHFGYQRIAHQLALVLDIGIDKDVVRRILAKHYRPDPRRRDQFTRNIVGFAVHAGVRGPRSSRDRRVDAN